MIFMSYLWMKLQYLGGKYEMKRRENRCLLRLVNIASTDAAEFGCVCEGDQTFCEIQIEG